MKKWICAIIGILSLGLHAQNEALFNSATTDYNEGRYEEAAEKYEQILENGEHSAAVYFNLGNSYYKLNRIAPSIYNYEKALLLDPGDSEIKNNLGFAQNMTLDDIDTLPQTGVSKLMERTTGLMTFDQWAYLAVCFMILFVLLYIAYYYLQYASHKRLAFVASFIFLFLSLSTVLFAWLQYREYEKTQPAIVFSQETSVKSEPNARSQSAFVLHEGTKVQVIEELNDWKKVQLADGSVGWLQAKDIRLLKDF